MERVFGIGATRLAIEFEGMNDMVADHEMSDSCSDEEIDVVNYSTSTPERESQSKKRLRGGGVAVFGDLSIIASGGEISTGEDSEEDLLGDSKKPKLGVSEKEISEEETDIERDGELELMPSGLAVPLQVTQGWLVPERMGPGTSSWWS